MIFQIDYSRESLKFINQNNIDEEEIVEDIIKVIEKFMGRKVNVDIKKMYGKWKGFYRLRLGKKRVIFEINFDEKRVFIERIDFRGDIYK